MENPHIFQKFFFNNIKMFMESHDGKNEKIVLWKNGFPKKETNSMSSIIYGMTRDNNYKKWIGGNNKSSSTKISLGNKISQKIRKLFFNERSGIDIKKIVWNRNSIHHLIGWDKLVMG